MDDRREPETCTIASALLTSFLTAESYDAETSIIGGRALDLLEETGFDVSRAKDRMKRLRVRLLSIRK